MKPRSLKYWRAIFRKAKAGQGLSPRMTKALSKALKIHLVEENQGQGMYLPSQVAEDRQELVQRFSQAPEFLQEILDFKPTPLQEPYKKTEQRTLFRSSHLIRFRMPSYTPFLQKIIDLGKPLLLLGPNGSGKTRLVQEMAQAQRTQKVMRVNMDGSLTPESFLGAIKVRSVADSSGLLHPETFFQEGPVTQAVRRGHWLLLDEIDKALPEYLCALHPLAEDPPAPLILLDDGGRQVIPHPDFRLICTSNTLGHPEELGSGYAPGTSAMNGAFLDRFSIYKVGYTDQEEEILQESLGNPELAQSLIQVAKLTRQSVLEGEVHSFDFSTRRLLAIAATFSVLRDLSLTLEVELLSRLTSGNRTLVESFISNVFGHGWRERTWSL